MNKPTIAMIFWNQVPCQCEMRDRPWFMYFNSHCLLCDVTQYIFCQSARSIFNSPMDGEYHLAMSFGWLLWRISLVDFIIQSGYHKTLHNKLRKNTTRKQFSFEFPLLWSVITQKMWIRTTVPIKTRSSHDICDELCVCNQTKPRADCQENQYLLSSASDSN